MWYSNEVSRVRQARGRLWGLFLLEIVFGSYSMMEGLTESETGFATPGY